MSRLLAALLVLLTFAPACVEEPGDDMGEGGITLDSPPVERCEEMVACGQMECAAENQALVACNDDVQCDVDAAAAERDACLIDAECWLLDCDSAESCLDVPEETDVYTQASLGMQRNDMTTCDSLGT